MSQVHTYIHFTAVGIIITESIRTHECDEFLYIQVGKHLDMACALFVTAIGCQNIGLASQFIISFNPQKGYN